MYVEFLNTGYQTVHGEFISNILSLRSLVYYELLD